MLLNGTRMGGENKFVRGNRLIFSTGDFHKSVRLPGHAYSVVLLDDKGTLFKSSISSSEREYFSFPVSETARWVRAEIFDETRDIRIAIGNPIWNA